MKYSRFFILFSVISITFFASCDLKKNGEGEWVQLFNGKDLTGWTPKITGYETGDNFGNTFRVEDGIIKVRYDQYDSFDNRFGHLFYEDQFSHYKLRVEYRIVGDQCPGAPGWAYKNSGIMVHGQTPESMEKDQDFPTSVEVQLLGSDSLVERTNMNVCTPGTNIVMNNELIQDHCINSSSDYFFGEGWFTAEVEVRGNEVIRHIINGDTVLQYSQPQLDERDATYAKLIELNNGDKMLIGGTISLQSEGHPIDFRKVEIMILKE
ncbi:DUF1080 domain-containing protein [uncultured Proteiniphilum sp.]|uniref:3-keto-disaccharide hydrolase n=1 Tax=uncultured Proteiniphilum sp. TaxID=497637 RepID=UPI002639ADBD|nr:DUF1080 domain-containing protein [uncultured Proteiniphilum sp.]